MHDSEIETKIKEDLKKSGFYSEMKALSIFKNRRWDATGVSSYFDLDENKSRESDITAKLMLDLKEDGIENYVASFICAEVKKSGRPWIVFKEDINVNFSPNTNYENIFFQIGLSKEQKENIFRSPEANISKKTGWIGTGMHEAFKEPNQASRWYSALVSACKAAEHNQFLYTWDKVDSSDTSENIRLLLFSKPLIVLDGKLMSASFSGTELEIENINYATITFGFKTEKYKRGIYKVDITTLESLDEYLEVYEKSAKELLISLKNMPRE